MKGISEKIFSWCPNVTSVFHTFHRCNKLEKIPEGLFDPLTKLTNVGVCFKSCTSIETVPYNLFDKCPNITDAYECFCGGRWNGDNGYNRYMSITSPLPPLWERSTNIGHARYAAGCINA